MAAAVTKYLFVTCFLAVTLESCCAQITSAPGLQSVFDIIRSLMRGSSSSSNNNNNINNQAVGPTTPSSQLSLIESFGPVSLSLLNDPQTLFNNPFSSPIGSQPSPTLSTQSQLTGTPMSPGPQMAQNIGGGGGGGGGGGESLSENNDFSSSPTSLNSPGSAPLEPNILQKIASLVNQGPTGISPTSSAATSSPTFGGQGLSAVFGSLPANNAGLDLFGLNGGAIPPFSPSAGLMFGPSSPLRTQAFLRMGRRLGKKLGVKEYYDIHGCEDPALLFSGRQKVMATVAMAQGCHSPQAMQICNMVQVKERTSNSLLTSSALPLPVRSRLESCLSAKVFFSSLSRSSFISSFFSPSSSSSSPSSDSGVPSLQECGVLLSSVMDGGSLDPESMRRIRRRTLPWMCNESNLGPSGFPYRVCCPGKVAEPTLQEAHIIRRMVNA